MGAVARSRRSISHLRRALRRTLLRRTKPSLRPTTLGPILLSSLLITIFLLLRPPAPFTLHLSAAPPAPGYAPLLHRVDAIVGRGLRPHPALVDFYHLPPAVVANISAPAASRLYWKLVYADVVAALRSSHIPPAAPTFRPAARLLFVHTQNGLGNRLRALASGIALARATGRIPVVVWERDPHLGASFHHLFETRSFGSDIDTVLYKDLVVLESFPHWQSILRRSPHWHPVNYMVKDGPGTDHHLLKFDLPKATSLRREPANWMDSMGGLAPADKITVVKPAAPMPASATPNTVSPDAHLYFKSAYVATTRPEILSAPQHVNRELMALQPSKAVMKIFESQDRNALSKAIGIHIRSRTLAHDNVNVDTDCEYTAQGAKTTDYWRSKSQLPVFINRMRSLTFSQKEKGTKFFVAVDDVQLLKRLKEAFPGRIMSISRECDDRDESCVLYAMADLLCLSKTRKIYGSNWSSFTEAAARLGNKKVYLSGVHFGKDKKRKRGETRRSLWQRLVATVMTWTVRDRKESSDASSPSNPFANCKSRS